jgi:GDPmannose 4,6-dehydratase
MPTALITGIAGQDGAYLAKLLLSKNYRVCGLIRGGSPTTSGLDRLERLGAGGGVELVDGNLLDLASLIRIIETTQPDEVYNFAVHCSSVASWRAPLQTGQVTGLGPVNVLEALRLAHPSARFFQASSAEMFSAAGGDAKSETTPLDPRSPYAAAKVFAHRMTAGYRETFGLHASADILFNHESPLRGMEFVTRKIADGVARIKLGKAKTIELGNLEARRDWGHARDHVRAIWLMLQQDAPGDYVIATGRTTSIGDFCRLAFSHAGLRAEEHVTSSPTLLRASELDLRYGDASKAAANLGWRPETSLEQLVAEMVDADLARHKANTDGE